MQRELETTGKEVILESKAEQKLLLTIPETAYRLGMGRSFVYELVMRGEIPSVKLGRARRVPVSALEEFVKRQIAEQTFDHYQSENR